MVKICLFLSNRSHDSARFDSTQWTRGSNWTPYLSRTAYKSGCWMGNGYSFIVILEKMFVCVSVYPAVITPHRHFYWYRNSEEIKPFQLDPPPIRTCLPTVVVTESSSHEPVQRQSSRFEVVKAPDVFVSQTVAATESQRSQERQLMTLLPSPEPLTPVSIQSNDADDVSCLLQWVQDIWSLFFLTIESLLNRCMRGDQSPFSRRPTHSLSLKLTNQRRP